MKKEVCRHKGRKTKLVENMGRKKSLLSELVKNILNSINQEMVTYNMECIRQNLIFPFFNEPTKKVYRKFTAKKMFSCRGEK